MSAHRRLQWLLPRAFRERNGEAMADTFEARLAAARRRGRIAALALWAREAADLTETGIRLRAAGWTRRPARDRNPVSRREDPRRGHVAGFLEDFGTDVRLAVRGLVRQPVFAIASVGTLALGIGGVTALWSMVYAVLLKPLPYWEAPGLVRVSMNMGVLAGEPWPAPVRHDVLQAWTERAQGVEEFASIKVTGRTVDLERAERLPVALVSTNLFDLIGVTPALGRSLLPEDGENGAGTGLGARVVLLSHEFWTSAFGRDPAVIGRSLLISGDPWAGAVRVPHTIVGVLPPDLAWFDRPGEAAEQPKVWIPRGHVLPSDLEITESVGYEVNREVIARLRPGSSISDVAVELGAIRKEFLAEPAPQIPPQAFVDLAPVSVMAIGPMRDRLLLPLAAAMLVLTLACLNVANLLLGRLPSRAGELSMRGALGAGRSRLVRQLVTEALVLSGFAAAVGALLAAAAVRLTGAWAPAELALLSSARLDLVALAFCVALATACALAFGLAPALTGSRAVRLDRLRSGRNSGARARGLLRPALLAGELAIALAVVGSAALVVRSFAHIATVELGFRPEGALVASMTLPREGYQVKVPPRTARGAPGYQWLPTRLRLAEELVARLEKDPRVAHAAVSAYAPLRGNYVQTFVNVRPEGAEQGPRGPRVWNVVTPGWFGAVGLTLLSGRDFRNSDRHEWPESVPLSRDGRPTGVSPRPEEGVAIVNESFGAFLWPGEDPLGKRMRHGNETLEVVGVVADDRHGSVTTPPMPTLYTPLAQEVVPRAGLWNDNAELHVLVRATDERRISSLAPLVRDAVRELDSRVAVHHVESMEDVVASHLRVQRFSLLVLTAFGALAWLIAAAGVFGVLAYLVAQRTHEIGVRLALGCKPANAVALVLREVAGLSLLGLTVGVWGALAAGKLLQSWLYEVEPTDPVSLAAAVALLLVAAVAAAWLPVRWAASVDPAVTLRMDG